MTTRRHRSYTLQSINGTGSGAAITIVSNDFKLHGEGLLSNGLNYSGVLAVVPVYRKHFRHPDGSITVEPFIAANQRALETATRLKEKLEAIAELEYERITQDATNNID